jgi:hypothetical protein
MLLFDARIISAFIQVMLSVMRLPDTARSHVAHLGALR